MKNEQFIHASTIHNCIFMGRLDFVESQDIHGLHKVLKLCDFLIQEVCPHLKQRNPYTILFI